MVGDTTPSRVVVQSVGKGYRFPAAELKSAIRRDPGVLRLPSGAGVSVAYGQRNLGRGDATFQSTSTT